MDWLTKNELIPHGDSRLTRRGGFDPLGWMNKIHPLFYFSSNFLQFRHQTNSHETTWHPYF